MNRGPSHWNLFGPRRWDKMCQCLFGVMIRIVVTASGPAVFVASQWCHSLRGLGGERRDWTFSPGTWKPKIYCFRKKVTQVQPFLDFVAPNVETLFTNHSPIHRGIPLINVWTPHLPPLRINRIYNYIYIIYPVGSWNRNQWELLA